MLRFLQVVFFLILQISVSFGKADLDIPSSAIVRMSLHRSGKIMAVAYKDLGLRIWSVPEGNLLFSTNSSAQLSDLAFSYDGSWLFAADKDGNIQTISTSTGLVSERLSGSYGYEKTCVAMGPNGKNLIYGDRVFGFSITNTDTKKTRNLAILPGEFIQFTEYAPSGNYIYASGTQRVAVIDAKNFAVKTYPVSKSYLTGMQISTSGKRLVFANSAKEVIVMNTSNMQIDRKFSFDQFVVSVSIGENVVVATLIDGSLRILDLDQGKVINETQSTIFNGYIICCQVSPDDSLFYTGSEDGEVLVWNTKNLQSRSSFTQAFSRITKSDLSANSNFLGVNYRDGKIKVFDLKSLQEVQFSDLSISQFGSLDFHNLKDGLLTYTTSDSVYRKNISDPSSVLSFGLNGLKLLTSCFSNEEIVVLTNEPSLLVLNSKMEVLKTIKLGSVFTQLEVHSNGSKVLVFNEKSAQVIDVLSGTVLYIESLLHRNVFTSAKFHPTESKVYFSTKMENSIKVIDYQQNVRNQIGPFKNLPQQKGQYQVTPFGILNLDIRSNGEMSLLMNSPIKYVYNLNSNDLKTEYIKGSSAKNSYLSINADLEVSELTNGEILLRKTNESEPALSLVSGGNEKHCWMLADRSYYWSTKLMAQGLRFYSDGLEEPFEHTDLYKNRPDIVVTNLTPNDEAKAKYKKLVQKRQDINEVGDQGVLRVLNNELPLISTVPNLNISLWLSGYHGSIPNELEVNINGVIVDQMTLNTSKAGINLQVPVRLSEGKNIIRFRFNTELGWSSYSSNIFVIHEPKLQTKPKVHFIGIGATEFKKNEPLVNGKNDIAALIGLLNSKVDEGIFESLIIDTVTGKNVTKNNVYNLLDNINDLHPNDLLVTYYVGHGVLDEEKKYFLATYNLDFDQPELEGLSVDTIDKRLVKLGARKRVLFVNACFSGQYDEDLEMFYAVQDQFVDTRNNTGTFVIASSNSNEYSYANSRKIDEGYTLFGYSLVKSLKRPGTCFAHDLNDRINRTIKRYERQQNTSYLKYNYLYNFRLW